MLSNFCVGTALVVANHVPLNNGATIFGRRFGGVGCFRDDGAAVAVVVSRYRVATTSVSIAVGGDL